MKYITYVNEFHAWNEIEMVFIKNILTPHLKDNEENQTEIEHILDYLFHKPTTSLSYSYSHLLAKAEKYFKKQNDNVVLDKSWEVEGVDYKTIHTWDWFSVVELISEKAFKREGKLMSHCVGSYANRDVTIYSLRDDKNLPHCTIEKDVQIKGKGNGKIIPKYIKYVVEFLEITGMNIRDNEMENLWYTNVSFYKQIGILKDNLTLFRDTYHYWTDNIFNCEVKIFDNVREAKEAWAI